MHIVYGLLFLIFALAFIEEKNLQSNNSPKVTILKPEGKAINTSETVVPYKIEVKDVEDGFSGYEEIRGNEVFMKVAWISDSNKLAAYEAKEKKAENLYRIITNNGCVNCHLFRQKLAGPSFEQITKKYATFQGAITMLADKIQNGSKGVWGDTQQMPAHPAVTEEEAQLLVKWIFDHSTDNHFQYIAGLEGALQFNSASKPLNGFYVFTASYTDHGLNEKDFKTASHTILVSVDN